LPAGQPSVDQKVKTLLWAVLLRCHALFLGTLP
jgi:hypothetical protein